jgi:hypothetical protein
MTPAAATHTHQVSAPISSVGSGAPGDDDDYLKKKTKKLRRNREKNSVKMTHRSGVGTANNRRRKFLRAADRIGAIKCDARAIRRRRHAGTDDAPRRASRSHVAGLRDAAEPTGCRTGESATIRRAQQGGS